MNDDIDLHDALRRGHDLAVLEDGRTVPMRRDPDGDARLYYDLYAAGRRGWYYRANGRWCAEHDDAEKRERHPRVVATLASAGADDEVRLSGTPEHVRKFMQHALSYGMNPDRVFRRYGLHGRRPDLVTVDDVGGHDEPDALQPGDYVLLDDLDGPQHLARVAQAMLTGCPDARRGGSTWKCADSPRHDWLVYGDDFPLVVGIDSRDGEVWCMPVDSNGQKRRRSPDDVLRADSPRINGCRVVTRYPAPDDEVGIAFVTNGGSSGPRTVRAAGRDFDGTPCVWLDGDGDVAFRRDGDRFTYCGYGDIVLVEHDVDHDEDWP